MSNRRLKVYRKTGCDSDAVPEMRISGLWLSKLGFSVGGHVELALDDKQIVIRPIAQEEPELKRKR